MPPLEVRQKALLAAGTVVLALTAYVADPLDSGAGGTVGLALGCASEDADLWAEVAPDCLDEMRFQGLILSVCCDGLFAWCEEHYTEEHELADCKYGYGTDEGTGCFPWGPPVPPRARSRLA